MNVLSLFSGIGGLDLGLQRAGMRIVGQVEIDPWCRKILAKHWPEVPRHDDVRTCAEWWGGRDAPDLVAGGFPCQPVSVAGLKLAQADSRWLWPSFRDVVRQLRPRFVLVENVPGLLARGMGDVLGDLATIGYDAEWDCVPAAFVGAPHIRNRVFIVAYPAKLLGDGGHGQPERQVPEPRDRGGAAHVANANGDRARQDARGSRASAPAGPGNGPQRWREPGPDIGCSSPDVADAEGLSSQLRAATGERPGRPASGRAHANADREPLVWPAEPWTERFAWPAEPDVGRVAHGIPHRVDRLRGLGNAVVPQVAEHIGRLIMEAAA